MAVCQTQPITPGTDCGLVRGGLSVFLDEETSSAESKRINMKILSVIQGSFENGTYLTAYPGITKIAMASVTLFVARDENIHNIADGTTFEMPNDFPKTISFIVIGVVSAAVIVAVFVLGKSERQEEINLEDGSFDVIFSDSDEEISDLQFSDDERERERNSMRLLFGRVKPPTADPDNVLGIKAIPPSPQSQEELYFRRGIEDETTLTRP